MVFFFFFKQKTAYEMRISDWSSDVCSSDLQLADGTVRHFGMVLQNPGDAVGLVLALADRGVARAAGAADRVLPLHAHLKLIFGVVLTLLDFFHRQFVSAPRFAAGIFRRRGFGGDRLPSADLDAQNLRDMNEGAAGVVAPPRGGRARATGGGREG